MLSWTLDITLGEFFLDFSWIGVLLVLATLMRRYIVLIQKYLIPNNLVAGVLGLIIGMNGLQWIDLNTDRLGAYVYHLLALMFIAISLRAPQKKLGLSSVKFGLIFIIIYLIQALIGMTIAFSLIYTVYPDLFAGIGLLPPLAFGMNPGIAFSIGQNWELYGFESGAVVGLTFAAVGFLVAYTIGIWIVRKGVGNGEASYLDGESDISREVRTGIIPSGKKTGGGKLTTSAEAIESLTLHLALIGFAYILTYYSLKGLELVLVSIGAENEITTLWSFHFIAAALTALFLRKVIDIFKVGYIVDDTTMTRCANFFMDFMIAASVAAISFAVVKAYLLPIILISIFVGSATWLAVKLVTKNTFKNYQLERYVAIFGNMTGTIQSALVLLRVLDPRLKSPVSYNLVYGSGLALVFGFPLLILINAPVHYFADITTGYWFVTLGLLTYLLLILMGWKYLSSREG